MSQLLEMLGCQYPILQGPIGELYDPGMVAAVSEAGAFGVLALGFVSDLEQVKALVGKIRELTDKPFGANLMISMNPNNDQILEILYDAGVRVVTTSGGSPKKIYPKIKEMGMQGLHVTLSAPMAAKSVEAGADGVVVSGTESGGLRTLGPESTNFILIPLTCDMVKAPVVAAGGIADKRGYRAAMALGAQGVQIGTAFLAAEESPACQAWKEAIMQCGDAGTVRVPLGPMAMRAIMNPKLKEMVGQGEDFSKEYNLMNAGQAWRSGDFDLFPAGAGQVSALISKIRPVKDIIHEMVS
ncbi:Putative enoyl- (acyl-carrier protein) reductase II [Desulfatibacillum aliphaticivorans]|uniref:Enoyl-(Acyl-carrier protein) reductase II n=1 Tax=Desulfatibacillum aliphaticivorans TaxID=218208 RepID=B8FBI2_DESAL|nr:nitronate monooxygenase [Desulfatibacillum aliphaticivorans]ACL04735.1 Putative enoyl- (acyl-carrier protein) reductase II [Desulfatibacillum aliphaticivorans]